MFFAYDVPQDTANTTPYSEVAAALLAALGHLGRHEDVDRWLEKFKSEVEDKSVRYIWMCDVAAFAHWIRKDYDGAIKWGTEGVRLISESHFDTFFEPHHTLGLALRDSGRVSEALTYFLGGETLEAVLTPAHFDNKRSGAFYGNIGRCLQMEGRYDDALVCLKKSARLLEAERNLHAPINRGWAAHWLGETLVLQGNSDLGYAAHRTAAAKWKNISPMRSQEAAGAAQNLVPLLSEKTLIATGDWECEQRYLGWLSEK